MWIVELLRPKPALGTASAQFRCLELLLLEGFFKLLAVMWAGMSWVHMASPWTLWSTLELLQSAPGNSCCFPFP